MELPQELIDSIIDAVVDDLDLAQDPWAINNTPDVLETLKSCALVTSAFVHPCQLYIFHGITLSDDARISPLALYTLIMQRPHLASYVRAIYFEYGGLAAIEQKAEHTRHIFASVTNLRRLDVHPITELQWQSHPEPLRAAFIFAFALPYLRHITLWYFGFEDALELQTLLAKSTGLKKLVLRSITFENTEPAETLEMPTDWFPSQVVLDSLQLYFLGVAQLQALLDSFTIIDITRLRSLYLHNSSMNSLLRLNASTIQHVKISVYYSGASLSTPFHIRFNPLAQPCFSTSMATRRHWQARTTCRPSTSSFRSFPR
jgi:hypothetical protein